VNAFPDLLWPMLLKALLAIVLVFGIVGIATGIALLASSSSTIRFFRVMNRWVSLRCALKASEVVRDIEQPMHRNRFWIGIPLIAGGLLSLFAMTVQLTSFDLGGWVSDGRMLVLLRVVAESLRWFLIIGSVLGVVVGLMLCFWPEALRRIESGANRWISTRQMMRGADDQHPVLDRLVEAHPVPSGWIFASTGIGVSLYAAARLLAPF
jgi:hypothetical protein